MATRRELEYILSLQDTTKRGFETLEQRIRELDHGFDRVGTSSSKAGFSAASAFKVMGAAIAAAGLKEFVADSVRSFASFEKELSLVGTLSDEAFKDLPRIGDGLRKMALQSGQSFEDLTKAEFDMVSATGDVKTSLESLDAAMQLAIAGGTDVSTTTNGLTTLLNAFSISGREATRVANSLFEAQQFGKTTVALLAANLGQVAPAARTANVSMEELLGTMGAVTRQLPTNIAATSLAQFFYAIANASDEVIEKSRKMAAEAGVTGFEFSKAGVQAEGLAVFLQKLSRTAGDDSRKLTQLGISTESLKGALVATQNGARDVTESIKKQTDAVAELGKGVERMAATTAAQLDRLKAKWEDLKLSSGGALKGLGTAAAERLGLDVSAEGLSDFAQRIADADVAKNGLIAVMRSFSTGEELQGETDRRLATGESLSKRLQDEFHELRLAIDTGSQEIKNELAPKLDDAFQDVLATWENAELGSFAQLFADRATSSMAEIRKELDLLLETEKKRDAYLSSEAARAVPRTSGTPLAGPSSVSFADLMPKDGGSSAFIFPPSDAQKQFAQQIEDAMQQRRDAALELRKVGLDSLGQELADIDAYYAQRRADVAGNEEALKQLRLANLDEVNAALKHSDAEQLDARKTFEQHLAEIIGDASLARLQMRGDEVEKLDAWLLEEETQTRRHYEELRRQAEEHGVDSLAIEEALQEDLEALRGEYQRRERDARESAADEAKRARQQAQREAMEGDDFGAGFVAQIDQINDRLTMGKAGADLASDSYHGLSDALFDVGRRGEEAGTAFRKFTETVKDSLARIVTDRLAAQALELIIFGVSGGTAGTFATLFGTATKLGSSSSAPSLSVPKAAAGGVFDTPYLGGEAGPEAAVPLPDGRRIPVQFMGAKGGRGDVSITVHLHQTIAPQLIDSQGARAVLAKSAKDVAAVITSELERNEGLRTRVRHVARGR